MGLDFGGSTQTQQSAPQANQNTGFDFFGGQAQSTPSNQTTQNPSNNQGFEGFARQSSLGHAQAPANSNDLMGLDFGAPAGTNTTTTTTTVTTTFETTPTTQQNSLPDSEQQKKVDLAFLMC